MDNVGYKMTNTIYGTLRSVTYYGHIVVPLDQAKKRAESTNDVDTVVCIVVQVHDGPSHISSTATQRLTEHSGSADLLEYLLII